MNGNLDGKSVYVIGKNGTGKSSFIQAIFLACKLFGNKPYVKVGEDKGIVKLQLGEGNEVEYSVERAFTAGGDAVLTIRDAKGKALKSVGGLTPQKWLDQLMGTSMYYLSEFLEYDPKKQVKLFKEWFKIDTTKLDKQYQETYDKRTEEGREELRLKKVVERHHYRYDDVKKYAEKKDITKISKELVEINQLENDKRIKDKEIIIAVESKQEEIQTLKEKKESTDLFVENTKLEIANHEKEIQEMRDRIELLTEKRINLNAAIDDRLEQSKSFDKDLAALESDLETIRADGEKELEAIVIPNKEDIEVKIKKAEEFNSTVDEVKKYSEDLKALHAKEKDYRDLTVKLQDIEKLRKQKLEEANVPVPGLTFDENSLIYEDKPFIKDVINDAKIAEVLLTLLLRTNQQETKKTGEDKLSIFRLNGGDLTDSTFKSIMDVVEAEGGEVFVEIPDDEAEDIEIKFIEKGE